MRIAIVGSGVSGLVAAYLLHRNHEITVFEASARPGGHANTYTVNRGDESHAVDTGFVVFNEAAYPNFIRLLDELGVSSQPSDMSFSVQCEKSGLEYASHCLFAQKRNLVRPRFYRMLRDLVRFFRESREVLDGSFERMTLGDYLAKRGYSRVFIEDHLVPMGSAIWSAQPGSFDRFPVRQFVRFFENHGFLQVRDRSPWRTVSGGSQAYVHAICRRFPDRLRLSTPITGVRRSEDGVILKTAGGESERFDQVVLAVHSDQALGMLDDPSEDERRILGTIRYQQNETVLHTDVRLLPRRKAAWASWNYLRPANAESGRIKVTYNMNRLQRLSARDTFCVTLNRTDELSPSQVVESWDYAHPVFDADAFQAQKNRHLISGVRRTHYCGAYWGYGFHEDGVRSGLAVAKALGEVW